MGTRPDILLLHVRDERVHAPRFQAQLDELNASAMAALTGADLGASLLAVAEHDRDEVLRRARAADAVVIMGGEDVDPSLYGGASDYPGSGSHEPAADRLMVEVIRQSLRQSTPLLGICRGHQLINVAFGGSLIEHMHGHHAVDPDPLVSTTVVTADGAPDAFRVANSARCTHHQAVRSLGDGLRVVARGRRRNGRGHRTPHRAHRRRAMAPGASGCRAPTTHPAAARRDRAVISPKCLNRRTRHPVG